MSSDIISEYNQTYCTSPSCYYVLDLLCVRKMVNRSTDDLMSMFYEPKRLIISSSLVIRTFWMLQVAHLRADSTSCLIWLNIQWQFVTFSNQCNQYLRYYPQYFLIVPCLLWKKYLMKGITVAWQAVGSWPLGNTSKKKKKEVGTKKLHNFQKYKHE